MVEISSSSLEYWLWGGNTLQIDSSPPQATKHIYSHTHSHPGVIYHVFRRWVETGEPRANPRTQEQHVRLQFHCVQWECNENISTERVMRDIGEEKISGVLSQWAAPWWSVKALEVLHDHACNNVVSIINNDEIRALKTLETILEGEREKSIDWVKMKEKWPDS